MPVGPRRMTSFRLPTALLALLVLATAPPALPAEDEADPGLAQATAEALAMEAELVETCATVRQLTVAVLHKRYPRQGNEVVPGAPAVTLGYGSGVIVERASRLWVVTNVHVIQGADVVTVATADGKERDVRVHDTIPQYDIALLAFPRQPRDLNAFALTPNRVRVSKSIEVGAWVVATGNPFGLALDGASVASLGVLSGRDRILGGQFLYGNALQHDAEVNPGNSGGPLWNHKGELIGINGMIATRPGAPGAGPANTGASFSIPIHQVNAFLLALIESGTDAKAGQLGVELKTAVDERGNPRGAEVVKVDPQSPAGPKASKGLEPGDVIIVIWGFGEDHRVRTASDVTNLLSLCREGTYLKIKYKRGKRFFEWSGRLAAPAPGGPR